MDESLLPFHWYKRLVLLGMRYHGFAEDYIQEVERVESVQDPALTRRRKHESLLRKWNRPRVE